MGAMLFCDKIYWLYLGELRNANDVYVINLPPSQVQHKDEWGRSRCGLNSYLRGGAEIVRVRAQTNFLAPPPPLKIEQKQ